MNKIFFACLILGMTYPVYASDSQPGEGHESIAKKRIAPAKVSPVVFGQHRYEVIPFGKDRGFNQDSGIIRAVNKKTGVELWALQIFEIKKDAEMEADKQEDFIVNLKIVQGKILIKTERGRTFLVDTHTREVTSAEAKK